MRTATPVFSALLLSACINPAFDPPVTTSDAADTSDSGAPTSTPTGELMPLTSDETTGSSGVDGGPTDDGTTVPAADTSTSTGDESTGSTGEGTGTTDDVTTGDPLSCWDQPVDNWPQAMKLDQFLDPGPGEPEISPDGLSLVYIAGMVRRPFRATRAQRYQPFTNGVPFVVWVDQLFAPGYPSFSLGFEEMFMISFGDVYVAEFKPGDVNSQYEQPTQFFSVNTSYEESHPNGVADGTRLLLQRDDGPALSPELFKSYRFYEYRRDTPEALEPFGEPVDVSPPMPPLQLILCPALSPDGLHLFFLSTLDATLEKETADETTRIYHVQRADLASAWGPATPLKTIPSTGGVLCPSSVTADGCSLAYYEFPYSRGDPPYRMFLAERPL